MTVELDEARRAASASPTGSGETEPSLQCPHCPFVAATERGLSVHVAHKHKDRREVAFEDRPARVAPPPAEPKAPPKPTVDLEAVGKELATNIEATGQLIHAGLYMLKVRHAMTGAPPPVDTHLGWAVQLRARMTAAVLMDHAAKNEALMRLVLGFNGLFKGGELATVIGSHVIAAAATAGVVTPITRPAESMLIPDVLQAVERENRELEAQLRAAAAAQNGQAS